MPYSAKERLTYRTLLELLHPERGMHHTALAFQIERPRAYYTAKGSTAFVRAIESALWKMAEGGLVVRQSDGGMGTWVRTEAGTKALRRRSSHPK